MDSAQRDERSHFQSTEIYISMEIKNIDLHTQHSETICIICLENVGGSASALSLPCSHTYHYPCITKWMFDIEDNAENNLLSRKTCPVCLVQIGGMFLC